MMIKRVGPVSCARIAGILYAIIGLFIGALFSLLSGFASTSHVGRGISAVLGVAAIVVFPILYGGIGFLSALLFAWLYNLLVGVVGGIQVELE